MQSDITNWFLANRLSLNISKTQNMNFSLRTENPSLQYDSQVKFLGVYMDAGLTWESHVEQLSGKLSRIIYLIRNLTRFVFLPILMTAYHGYFASNITYAILNWGHSSHACNIFRLQRRCIRVVTGLRYRDCCRQSFRDPRVLTFPSAYILHCLSYLRSKFFMSCWPPLHDHHTRQYGNIRP